MTLKCMEVSGKMFTEQTGQFPNSSSRGYQYIMVAYNQDSNDILAKPLKTQAEHELLYTTTTTHTHTHLKDHGLHPQMQILDNEFPTLIKEFFKE